MWSAFNDVDLFLITTNSFITGHGHLVMGGGIAGEAASRWPKLSKVLGELISYRYGHLGTYGLLVSEYWPEKKLGLFQTKRSHADKSDLTLIETSTNNLLQWLDQHKDVTVALNYPGVGLGWLKESDVEPIISKLPRNVQIWRYKR